MKKALLLYGISFVIFQIHMDSSASAVVAGTLPCTFEDSPVWAFGMSVLTTPSLPFDVNSHSLSDMQTVAKTLAAAIRGGQGLAAPQTNILLQMFIFRNGIASRTRFPLITANAPPLPDGTLYQVIINPVITKVGDASIWSCTDESCMSIPGFSNTNVPGGSSLNTERLVSFKLSYSTFTYKPDGTPVLFTTSYIVTADDQQASPTLNWVLQHEVDHLKGILFTERCIVPLNSCDLNALNNIKAGKTSTYYPIVVPPNQLVCPNG